MSVQARDKPAQARCLLSLGDIYRNRNELERAHTQYELSFALLKEMGDRLGQAQVLMGMAKTLTALKRSAGVCDCKLAHYVHTPAVVLSQHSTQALDYCCGFLESALKTCLHICHVVLPCCVSPYQVTQPLFHPIANQYFPTVLPMDLDYGPFMHKAIEINNKALEISTALGNKLFMYYCHVRLEEIYRSLGDEVNQLQEEQLAINLAAELDRVCGVCRQEYGDTPGPLEALPCAHIFHAKCVREVMQERERRRKKRTCPECRRTLVSSRTFLDCEPHDASV